MRISKVRLLIGAAMVLFALFKYCSSAETNPYTGDKQHITLSVQEEIAIGSQSAPAMVEQYGSLYPDEQLQATVDEVDQRLVNNSVASKTGYQYDLHLLADSNNINAFELPGGQVFITYALYSKLNNEDELAGVLSHEIGHIVGRHSADRLEKQGLTQGILNGVAVGFDTYTAQGAAAIASLINMKYGREDELQSDDLGVKFMMDARYDPYQMIKVMEILRTSAGPNRTPEFQSTHQDPENRIEKIKEAIEKYKKTSS